MGSTFLTTIRGHGCRTDTDPVLGPNPEAPKESAWNEDGLLWPLHLT